MILKKIIRRKNQTIHWAVRHGCETCCVTPAPACGLSYTNYVQELRNKTRTGDVEMRQGLGTASKELHIPFEGATSQD